MTLAGIGADTSGFASHWSLGNPADSAGTGLLDCASGKLTGDRDRCDFYTRARVGEHCFEVFQNAEPDAYVRPYPEHSVDGTSSLSAEILDFEDWRQDIVSSSNLGD